MAAGYILNKKTQNSENSDIKLEPGPKMEPRNPGAVGKNLAEGLGGRPPRAGATKHASAEVDTVLPGKPALPQLTLVDALGADGGNTGNLLIEWYPEGEIQVEDFHTGTVRFHLVDDGSKLCPSLLINNELFERMRAALQARRTLLAMQVGIGQAREAIEQREDELFVQIVNWRGERDLLERDMTVDAEARVRGIKLIDDEIARNEGDQEALKNQGQILGETLGNAYSHWDRVQWEADLILERAFGQIGVFPVSDPPEEQFQEPTMQREAIPGSELESSFGVVEWRETVDNDLEAYSQAVSGKNAWKFSLREDPDSTFNNEYYDYFPRPDPREAWWGLQRCRDDHRRAEVAFDSHRDDYHEAFRSWMIEQKGRMCRECLEWEFGQVWVKRGEEKTRKLKLAEEAYYEAVARAVEAGIYVDGNGAEPDFYGGEGGSVCSQKRKRIEDWMQGGPAKSYAEEEGAELEPNPSESLSVREGDPKRRKIDEYNERVGRDC
ncbi:hypothetical protein BU26DRAFT_584497 [Trematosphaeria pertusa]|uniref:Uncharacterized protein n=1 Tax=Trematosphaeria pertusa TaxID=390896 RepID=A0A6A6HX01_9PLEO|nr:uncharacterized protein BU26DRAFT_584497 [Trematosphaeria pertusa]KAF2242298.1 hypothetical protein BU26DRAFT_584497 [Trematosphaeria pertusa]